MKNELVFINKEQETAIIQTYQAKNYYIAKIDGNKINTKVDYMNAIIVAFKFPNDMFKNVNSIDSYNDWMRDLDWIGQYDGYILIIEHFEKMLNKNLILKETIIEMFETVIFPFWEEEVLHVVVGGKVKGFNVYLIK